MVNYMPVAQPPFRLSMLIFDRRYRGLTIQVVVFILVMLAAAWLVRNVITAFDDAGKTFSFDFLQRRAGYDIPQTLIPYTSDDTHLRATWVGLLNTLLVSGLGCVFATVIGVFVGVLRLSKNWLVSRLMTIYVEIFLNVPVLLWILVTLAIFTSVLPAPNAYRGEDPAATMILFNSIAPTNRYTAIPTIAMSNDPGSISLGRESINIAWIAYLVVIAAIVAASRAITGWAHKVQNRTGARPVTWWAQLLVIIVPLALLTWYFGLSFARPHLQGFNFTGGVNLDNAFVVLLISLSLYTAAFIAEIVRGGVMAVSHGQTEAAYALGLRPGRTMRMVVLPQALRMILPPLISQYLNLTKNSSLAIAVGYMDLRGTLGGTTLNQTGREMECMILMMLIYLAVCLIISGGMNLYNRSVALRER